jgi:superfamily II DNA or RNA helicase/predicted house-cleaning noncanonical NTP pyrophosphatase (MazG superfamily)
VADEYRIEKLIRDRIPEIIRADGREPDVRQVSEGEVRPFVGLKIIEEAFEVFEAFNDGDPSKLALELADVLEVMERMMRVHGLNWDEVKALQRERATSRGKFDLNYLLADPSGQRHRLYAAYEGTMLKALRDNLHICSKAHLAISFVMKSGVNLIYPALEAALERGASIRLLTSDYMDLTDPDALARLQRLPGDFEMKAYQEPSRSYHPKAYIFEHGQGLGMAFIGSSNLSASALQDGIEWNYQVHALDEGWPLAELIDKFEDLYRSRHSTPIDSAFIDDYRLRRRVPQRFVQTEDRVRSAIVPRPAQVEALQALEALRAEGERKGMVVAATGIGKTFLAAFDSQAFGRVLFLAHRDELLTQAQAAFSQVRPDAQTGFYRGGEYDQEADVLFASVGTLSRPEHLQRFASDRFDYVVVDEFHHAAAKSYRAVLHHFAPQFLLGLTATPYRGDNRDVFALCDGNVAYRVTFIEAIAFGWLSPFHYFGIYDETNYESIPWRNGGYDAVALSQAVETQARAAAILKAYHEHPSSAAIGFCVSIQHAAFMTRYFSEHGVPALAVHSGPESPERATAIQQLRAGEVKVLFTVDLFNEGVDIPEIDLVLFLRPTESPTIFLQQLGRGLRLHEGKSHLTVLDFIGNYKKVHYKIALVTGRLESDSDPSAIKKMLQEFTSGELALPSGVAIHFDLQAINLMTATANIREPRRQLLAEDFRQVEAMLGHLPTMLEMHRHGRYDVRAYRQEFGSWFKFLLSQERLGATDQTLETEAGPFLLELEKTAMTKSYKMVVLSVFLDVGGLQRPVPIDELVAGFRGFFTSSRKPARDLVGTEIEAIDQVSDDRLRTYLERNPLAAWTNPGKNGERTVYFAYDESQGTFSFVGPRASNAEAYVAAIADRVEFRLAEYFEVRFERKNVFNVINAGDERGIIMLGSDESAPIPRAQGWKPVMMNGRRWWAKFAKIAVNVLKEAPDDNASPNLLTEQLEVMFGPGGHLPQHGNRVRITPIPEETDMWLIDAVRSNAIS